MVKLYNKDWALVEFLDEAIIKLRLNTRPPWVRRSTGKPYESKYLKLTFKSGRSLVGI